MKLEDVHRLSDAVAEMTGEISAAANRMRLGLSSHSASTQATAQVWTGATAVSWAVGIVGVFAIVVAVAAVFVVEAYRQADARVAAERHAMQTEKNENLTDRVAVLERIIARMEREQQPLRR